MQSKPTILAALALTGALAAGAAQAHDRHDIGWSVSLAVPHGTIQVGHPVTVAPRVVYVAPPVRVVDYRPVYRHYDHAPRHRHYQPPTRWDHDGDGIPNRHDRVYNPRWDRDGDGIPNRHDPYPGRRGR